MLEFVLNFLFPTKCGFCGKINKQGLCPKCNYKLKQISKCEIKKVQDFYFDYQIYIFKYEGEIRSKLIDFKFNDKTYLAKSSPVLEDWFPKALSQWNCFSKFLKHSSVTRNISSEYFLFSFFTKLPPYLTVQNKAVFLFLIIQLSAIDRYQLK